MSERIRQQTLEPDWLSLEFCWIENALPEEHRKVWFAFTWRDAKRGKNMQIRGETRDTWNAEAFGLRTGKTFPSRWSKHYPESLLHLREHKTQIQKSPKMMINQLGSPFFSPPVPFVLQHYPTKTPPKQSQVTTPSSYRTEITGSYASLDCPSPPGPPILTDKSRDPQVSKAEARDDSETQNSFLFILDKQKKARLAVYLKTLYIDLSLKEPILPAWVHPVAPGALCPARLEPELRLSSSSHGLNECISVDQILTAIHVSRARKSLSPLDPILILWLSHLWLRPKKERFSRRLDGFSSNAPRGSQKVH